MSIVLAPYIVVFDKRKSLTPTQNRDEYKQKMEDRQKYNAKFVTSYLKKDSNIDPSEITLALGATIFLLYASFKGCCDIKWDKLFKFSPSTYCQYVDTAYKSVTEKYPNILKEFNELYNKCEQELNQSM